VSEVHGLLSLQFEQGPPPPPHCVVVEPPTQLPPEQHPAQQTPPQQDPPVQAVPFATLVALHPTVLVQESAVHSLPSSQLMEMQVHPSPSGSHKQLLHSPVHKRPHPRAACCVCATDGASGTFWGAVSLVPQPDRPNATSSATTSTRTARPTVPFVRSDKDCESTVSKASNPSSHHDLSRLPGGQGAQAASGFGVPIRGHGRREVLGTGGSQGVAAESGDECAVHAPLPHQDSCDSSPRRED
jgi:hypothetical protein